MLRRVHHKASSHFTTARHSYDPFLQSRYENNRGTWGIYLNKRICNYNSTTHAAKDLPEPTPESVKSAND